MKQCVALVSSRAVTCRGPSAVQRDPASRGLNVGWIRFHLWNVCIAVSVTRLACQAAAKSCIE